MTVTAISTCHHPRCLTSIKGYELACQPHWYQLPVALRNRIWRTWKSGDKTGHGRAITEAHRIWVANIEVAERPLRCHNCRTETILEDPDHDLKPVCLTCARASVPGQPAPLYCDRCGKESGLLIAVDTGDDIGPDLCPGCQTAASR